MTKIKATKKLTDIDFSGKNAAVALVGKAQGGGANNFTTLLVKSGKYTDEIVAKAAQIRVTMDIEDFLVRFYGLWDTDAEILARALGFETAMDDANEVEPSTYEDYINAQVAAIEVIKQLEQSEDIEKSLSELEPDDYISLLKSQELLEKAFKKIDKNSIAVAKTTTSGEGTPTAVANAKVVGKAKAEDVSSSKTKPTEKSKMTVKTVEQEVIVEMVEKSQFESIEKALKEQAVALEKALETVKQYEIEKAAAIQKSRKETLKSVVKDDTKVEALVKGLALVESDEIFQDVIKALEDMMTAQKNSDLFKEQGFSSEDATKTDETPLMKAVKAAAEKAKSAK
jgi:hypothetical protein